MRSTCKYRRSAIRAGAGDWLRNSGAKSPYKKTKKRQQIRQMKKLFVLALMLAFSSVMTASAADAKENWDKTCAKCHGADGKGQTKMGQKLGIKDYTDAKVQAEMKDDEAFKAIKEGVKDKDDKILMKAQEALSDDEIKALVAYMRSLKK
jgi:cytochrome c553